MCIIASIPGALRKAKVSALRRERFADQAHVTRVYISQYETGREMHRSGE